MKAFTTLRFFQISSLDKKIIWIIHLPPEHNTCLEISKIFFHVHFCLTSFPITFQLLKFRTTVTEDKHSICIRCIQIKFCYKMSSIDDRRHRIILRLSFVKLKPTFWPPKEHKITEYVILSTDSTHAYKTLWEKAYYKSTTQWEHKEYRRVFTS